MKPVYLALATLLIGLALFEVMMQPSGAERLELGLIFLVMALAMAAAARWLPRVARRNRSIRVTVALLSLAAFSIVVGGAIAVGNRMFLSEHDLRLLLVVMAFGIVSAIGFGITVSRPLTADLEKLSVSATRVAEGSLEPGISLDRRDEVGRLSAALDQMIARLELAESDRAADAEARQAFFAAIGHDLRTPLASLRAAIEAVRDGVVDNRDHYLASMERDVSALTSLVEDVYLLARLDSGALAFDRTRVDVTEVTDEAIDVLQPLAERRGVTLRLTASERVTALASPEPVARVLRNLLDNAIRHAPVGTAVMVQVGSNDQTATVRVVDHGAGFDYDFVDTAFDRFTRSDPARGRNTGGSGLGLAIAHGLVSALDGSIWVEPGPGGRVGFDLPTDNGRATD